MMWKCGMFENVLTVLIMIYIHTYVSDNLRTNYEQYFKVSSEWKEVSFTKDVKFSEVIRRVKVVCDLQ